MQTCNIFMLKNIMAPFVGLNDFQKKYLYLKSYAKMSLKK